MKKKIISVVLVLITVSLCACTYYSEDPFLTETESGADTATDTETEAKPEGPGDDFYTLTDKQSYDKYGCLQISGVMNITENWTDGKSFYIMTSTGETDDIITLGKTRYPIGKTPEVQPVCTDPLCTHQTGSGCPFDNAVLGNVTVFADRIYFGTNDKFLKVYDFKTNKSTELLERCLLPLIYKCDGNLYIQYVEEPDDDDETFELQKVYVKIDSDGNLTELGRLENMESGQYDFIYKDRYVIQSFYSKDEKKVYIYSHDLTTKEKETVCEFDCADVTVFFRCPIIMKYGDKILFDLRYQTKQSKGQDKEYLYLIDLISKEKELICTPDFDTYNTTNTVCLHSEKCIAWYEPRPDVNTPFILHIYFPASGETETYDLSEMAEKVGAVITLDDYLSTIETGAVRMKRWIDPNSISLGSVNSFEFDLESGRAYKYEYPAA